MAQSSSSAPSVRKAPAERQQAVLDSGAVGNDGAYRNKSLGLSFKVPAGWVLRTEEMNEREDDELADRSSAGSADTGSADRGPAGKTETSPTPRDRAAGSGCPLTGCGRVLLAAFSRPPEARGEEVNSSILIAAEDAASYPGLKDAAQYFGPLTEVAKTQGFTVDEQPYEVALGTKTLVRGDFHKDVGTRVMRQSTLAMLAHGYAISITVIGGTEDEVEELIEGLEFAGSAPRAKAAK